MRKIELSGAVNVRELGGMKSEDGREIRRGCFIRGATLDKLTEQDKLVLTKEHGLKTIIDLRTLTEISEKPDAAIEGVEHMNIYIYSEETMGISRGRKTEDSLKSQDLPDMSELYRMMITEPTTVDQFRKVLKRIMEPRDGAVLWHCTAGKDRCGMTSVLLERILGVSMDDIVEDYLLTNEVAVPFAENYYQYILRMTGNEQRAMGVKLAFLADRRYLQASLDEMDRLYGGIDGFIEKGLGFDKETIEAFRDKYLV